jgi:soluble lytic murein transglycosylase-like protein
MQVMPRDGRAASFMCVNGPCFSNRPTGEELEDPEFNVSYGTKYLARQVKRTGNMRDALKSYGPMDVGYYYADKILNLFNQYGNHANAGK